MVDLKSAQRLCGETLQRSGTDLRVRAVLTIEYHPNCFCRAETMQFGVLKLDEEPPLLGR